VWGLGHTADDSVGHLVSYHLHTLVREETNLTTHNIMSQALTDIIAVVTFNHAKSMLGQIQFGKKVDTAVLSINSWQVFCMTFVLLLL